MQKVLKYIRYVLKVYIQDIIFKYIYIYKYTYCFVILIAGTWTNWNKWSTCSVECGSGVQIRKRTCSEVQNLQQTSCKGSSQDIKSCVINNCSSKHVILHEQNIVYLLKIIYTICKNYFIIINLY